MFRCSGEGRSPISTLQQLLIEDAYLLNAMGEVLLSWTPSTKGEEIDGHRGQLQRLRRQGKHAWILVDSLAKQTRFRLNFHDHTFPHTERREAIHNHLRQWSIAPQAFDRIYLHTQENVEAPCYDITDYIHRCLGGDLSIADRLKGRTIFRLYQIEMQTEDLLTTVGVHEHADRILKEYFHELPDFLRQTVIGFCCNLPTFLSPLRCDPLSIPWSVELAHHSETMPKVELLAHLPLIFYETYDSATIRSAFWERFTQQFAKVCIGGLRKICRRWGLQFALSIPATAQALEMDLGTILNHVDRPILRVNQMDTPKQFLIAKWIVSKRSSGNSGGQIGICRSDASTGLRPNQLAHGSVLGFNSWVQPGHSAAVPSTVESDNLNRFLSIGVPKRSILILSPVHSLWTRVDGKGWNWITKSWSWLCQTVWELGYDFDIASETDLVTAKIDTDSHALDLKEGAYPLVLLPGCLSLQEGTVNLLTQFVKARGKLIALDPVPYLLNGRIGINPYPLERLLYRWRTSIVRGETNGEKRDQLKRLLRKRIKPAIQIYLKPDNSPTNWLAIQHRQSEGLDLFYLFSRGEILIETLVEIRWETAVEEWNAITGEQKVLDYWHANGKTYTALSFEHQQGRVIVARTAILNEEEKGRTERKGRKKGDRG